MDHPLVRARALRGVLASYRAVFRNAELNAELAQRKLAMPVLTIGAPEFFAHNVEQEMRAVAENVERAEVWEECGQQRDTQGLLELSDAA